MKKKKKKCEVVVIRSAGLSTKQQQGFIQPVFNPAGRCRRMNKTKQKSLYYYILLLRGCFVTGLVSASFAAWCVKKKKKKKKQYRRK